MKIYVGITDYDWFSFLKQENCDEVNFWKPGGRTNFKALEENDLFLFKLHSPHNCIVGGGFFVRFSILPSYLAWDAFERKNGTSSLAELNQRINKYKKNNQMDMQNDNIGCIILNAPFFFDEQDWIDAPENWSGSIVQGKTYSTEDSYGKKLYDDVSSRLNSPALRFNDSAAEEYEIERERYGKEQIILPRIGQGAFRIIVTETYHRRCSITGEKTLPVLEAAHVKPFADEGPNIKQNGLLLRSDVHKLFDKGYITVNDDMKIEVSKRLNQDYGNGKVYYDYHGKELINLPDDKSDYPQRDYIRWHNEKVYLG